MREFGGVSASQVGSTFFKEVILFKSLSTGKELRISPSPATDFNLRPEAGERAAPSPFLQNTGAMSCNSRGARNQATAAQFSAAPSALRSGFQLRGKDPCCGSWLYTRRSKQFPILEKLDLQARQASVFPGLGILSPWASSLPLSGVSGKSVFLRL